MKKIAVFFLSLSVLAGCGGFDSVEKRKNDEYGKLDGLFTKAREFTEIIEFFDFTSEDSREMAGTLKQIEEEFGPRVQIKRFPYSLGKPEVVAEASECARSQEKFQEFTDEYFANHFGKSDEDTLLEIALRISLNKDDFSSCLSSGIGKSRLAQYKELGDANNIDKIPSFLVDKEVTFSGTMPKENLSNLVTERLATPVEY